MSWTSLLFLQRGDGEFHRLKGPRSLGLLCLHELCPAMCQGRNNIAVDVSQRDQTICMVFSVFEAISAWRFETRE